MTTNIIVELTFPQSNDLSVLFTFWGGSWAWGARLWRRPPPNARGSYGCSGWPASSQVRGWPSLSPLSLLVGCGSEIVLLTNYPLNHYAISKFLASCLRTNTRLYTWFKGRAYDLSLILSWSLNWRDSRRRTCVWAPVRPRGCTQGWIFTFPGVCQVTKYFRDTAILLPYCTKSHKTSANASIKRYSRNGSHRAKMWGIRKTMFLSIRDIEHIVVAKSKGFRTLPRICHGRGNAL